MASSVQSMHETTPEAAISSQLRASGSCSGREAMSMPMLATPEMTTPNSRPHTA